MTQRRSAGGSSLSRTTTIAESKSISQSRFELQSDSGNDKVGAGEDIALIREALRVLRRIGLSYRYGGMGDRYRLAQEALECLSRVERHSKAG